MSTFQDSWLSGANIDFIEGQYARYLADPGTVDQSWVELFTAQGREGMPLGSVDPARIGPVKRGQSVGQGRLDVDLQAKLDQTVYSFRLRGHLLAELDPLGVPRPPLDHVADLGMVSRAHFNASELATEVEPQGIFDEPRAPVGRILERLRRTYTGRVGVEFMQIFDSERRRWLQRRMEHSDNRTEFTLDERRHILRKLTEAEAFEHTVHAKFQAAKRFSVEGGDALLPMLDGFLEISVALGLREVVIGMAHRGRLNVLANIVGKPPEVIFREFLGPEDPKSYTGRGDVKYHLGYSHDWSSRAGQKLHLSLAFNPSHLEVVYPVVVGRARAKQDRIGPAGRHAIVPLVIHGDASFSGQGLIAETLNFGGLDGYSTGGTVHVVINNQVGYTTLADQGRTSLYCTGVAQMLDIPIFHVNGDDAEPCVHTMRLAAEYRQRFGTDVVVDLVCYRKYGHNEGDEPAFTQPKMYELIRGHPSPRAVYAAELARRGLVSAAESQAMLDEVMGALGAAHTRSRGGGRIEEPSALVGVWEKFKGGADKEQPQVDTGVEPATLRRLLTALATTPEGFALHPGVQRVLDARRAMADGREQLNWGAAEMLAYATLLAEGQAVRVTGQDTERGTFAHRHAVLHDTRSGDRFDVLGSLSGPKAKGAVINSPLSEAGCLAFEFGYSLDWPDGLVAWEAQFGDFVNNAQVVIDQFIAGCEDKWRRLSGLTLLLPHGYEGAGPEHSSARLERFLELSAEDNLQVCYPTTAAQIFHLLRRQVLRPIRKPLVVMTPKSLLRLDAAGSPLTELATGRFQRFIDEAHLSVEPGKVTRLLLCSGKVYFDLAKARDAAGDFTVAIGRLEQLYPLPEAELAHALARYPHLTEVYWVQEEPRNMGAWRALLEPLQVFCGAHPKRPSLTLVSRVESASPATGFLKAHEYEQRQLVQDSLTRGTHGR